MPKGDIELPQEGRGDPRLRSKAAQMAAGVKTLKGAGLDLDVRPAWLKKIMGEKSPTAGRGMSRGKR